MVVESSNFERRATRDPPPDSLERGGDGCLRFPGSGVGHDAFPSSGGHEFRTMLLLQNALVDLLLGWVGRPKGQIASEGRSRDSQRMEIQPSFPRYGCSMRIPRSATSQPNHLAGSSRTTASIVPLWRSFVRSDHRSVDGKQSTAAVRFPVVHRDDARMQRQIEALGPKLLFAEVHVIGRRVGGTGQPDHGHRQ